MNSADFLFLFVTTRRPDVSYKRSRLKFITLSLSTFVKATLRSRNAVSFCAHVNVIHSFIQTATGPVACTRPGCCLTIYGMVGVDNPGQLLLRVFTVALYCQQTTPCSIKYVLLVKISTHSVATRSVYLSEAWRQCALLRRGKTRSSAIAEEPRDASCQLKSCQLPRNSAETTCTTSPKQIEVIKLEG